MTLRCRRARASDAETLRALHVLTFPCDDHEDYLAGAWWIVWDGARPIAFAGCRPAITEDTSFYFSRCGVLPDYRGRGLQRVLLGKRIRYARKRGLVAAITTTYCHTTSANNLIGAGFRLYDPVRPWGVEGTLYWRRTIQ
ncbi:GNAT family N-acetyltransferase [Xylophilus sp.]|uniref:GNAT family N-acetyltransferase n=1 Tax=Xylophilus sp. TaxID=2653893 RepID=UPI0013BCDE69|nr:GNAT family N-acetyltransferase [Xylophilus sp.]KAF1049319.1 MAG: hypothetical protein GAK38_00775 [Xylophilus sp.]